MGYWAESPTDYQDAGSKATAIRAARSMVKKGGESAAVVWSSGKGRKSASFAAWNQDGNRYMESTDPEIIQAVARKAIPSWP